MQRTRRFAASLIVAAAFALSLTTYSLAQGGPGPGHKHGMMADAGAGHRHACMHEGAKCPLQQLLAIADLKVEKTKSGAALQLSAKDPNKLAEVQKLAEELAAHLKSGACPMMDDTSRAFPGKPMSK